MRTRALPRSLALLALGWSACAPAVPVARPASPRSDADPSAAALPAAPRQQTELGLPFAGTWIVGQGYHGAESHHGYAAYALDLVKLSADGSAYARTGRRTQDWYGFGAELLATADGVVVRAIDRHPDNRVMGRSRDANTVIVQHVEGELSEYVHLQQGSLRVGVGERVLRGQVLAGVGNSGAETPHLHWALLSTLDPIQTRPAVFSDYEVRDAHGAWHPRSGTPRSGEVIRSVASFSGVTDRPRRRRRRGGSPCSSRRSRRCPAAVRW